MESTIYEIIFLAIIAGAIIYRLYSVLGTNMDGKSNVKPTQQPDTQQSEQIGGVVMAMQEEQTPKEVELFAEIEKKLQADSSLNDKLSGFKIAFPDFDTVKFIQGAKAAFEIITNAFAKGDLDAMKGLVSDNVYNSYKNIIDDRKEQGQNLEFEIIRIIDTEIKDVIIEKESIAKIQVNFATEQVNVLKDKDGKTISGSDSFINKVNDLWTFVKDITSANPNWVMVAAKSG